MTTFVLVHGAWHGAWCWERITPKLQAHGHRVIAVDLPGHGENSEPLTDLHGDSDALRLVLDELAEPCILVGHSYGGAVITDAGDHPNVAHVVYVAAFAIEGDENVLSAAGLVAATPATEGSSLSVADAIIGAEDGTSTLTPEGVAQLCYNECDAPTQAWAQQRVGKQSFATMSQTARRNAREHIASTYVVCTLDRIVPVALQRVFAQRCTNSVELATDHSPFASMPDTFTETLLAIAAGAGL